jgi:hypothetical protein
MERFRPYGFSVGGYGCTASSQPPQCRNLCDKLASPHTGSQAHTTALHPLKQGTSIARCLVQSLAVQALLREKGIQGTQSEPITQLIA